MQRLSNDREDKQNMRNNERRINDQRHEANMTSINYKHNERIRELDNNRYKNDLIHTENMDRQNKIFQLDMSEQNNRHEQIMDKQNKDFLSDMKKENNQHIENMTKIKNEREILNNNHQTKLEYMKLQGQQTTNQHMEKMRNGEEQHDEKMHTLKSNHEQTIEEMRNNREKYKYQHEKEMKEFEFSKNEIMEQLKNNHEEKMRSNNHQHDEKMKNIQNTHEKEMTEINNEFELEKMKLQMQMQMLQQMGNYMMNPNYMNFMNNMYNQQVYEKPNPQNQTFNNFPFPNMNFNIPNQFNQFNTPNPEQSNNSNKMNCPTNIQGKKINNKKKH